MYIYNIYICILSNYSRTAQPFFLPHPSAFSDPNGLRASLLVIRIPGWLVVFLDGRVVSSFVSLDFKRLNLI